MKKIIILISFFTLLQSSGLYASATDGMDSFSWSDSLGSLYEDIIDIVKLEIKDNFEIISKSAVGLLSSMAVIWIVVHLGRAFLTGKVIFSEFMIKMSLFLGLSALLQFKVYDEIVMGNLITLFDGLPTMFSDIDGDNVVQRVLSQSGIMVDEIIGYLSGSSWLSVLGDLIICFIMLITIIAFTLVVVLNVLSNSVKFYMVLSLGSIFILLAFFSSTRRFSVGAFSVVVASMFNITLLSVFLKIYSEVIITQLQDFNGTDVVSKAFIVIVFNLVSIYFINFLSEISNTIVGSALSAGKSAISAGNVGNMATNATNMASNAMKSFKSLK